MLNSKLDGYFEKLTQWKEESLKLRSLLATYPFEETLKWRQACYTLDGKNVVLIHGFKEYCALLFFKGALLTDPKHLLETPGQTQAGRQLRFSGLSDITARQVAVKAFVTEAIKIEKAGLKVKLKTPTEHLIPEELQRALDTKPKLKKAFEALTPGRRRGYTLHIAGAKQATTREARVQKHIPRILEGEGIDD